ncbi:hypothetical protein RI367_001603 [Sorochytrium milnesiophthora]
MSRSTTADSTLREPAVPLDICRVLAELSLMQKERLELSGVDLAQVQGEFVYFRATHAHHGRVILKYCNSSSSLTSVAKLRWEYYLTRGIVDVPDVIVPLSALLPSDKQPYGLMLPDYPLSQASAARAVTLDTFLSEHGTVTLDQALVLLRKVMVILQTVHQRGIMYRNFSFDTVILRCASGQHLQSDWSNVTVCLADFSQASKLSGERISPVAADLLSARDLRFMSPESTGRTNRALDLRSDFYSLGMLVHGALTGRSPSKSLPLLNIIHYHIAVQPLPLTEHYKQTPALCNDALLMRKAANLQRFLDQLIAKMPEKRYQSCSAILRDLDLLSGEAFRLQDFVPRPPYATEAILSGIKLYGRDEEINRLLQFQRQTIKGQVGGICMVSGSSGVGKTSLVQELVLPTFNAGGIYCFGKWDQFKRNLPMFAFSRVRREVSGWLTACTDLVSLLLLEEQSTLGQIVDAVKAALGDNVPVLADLIPNLHLLLGPSDTVASTSAPAERLLRTQQSLATFLEVVATYKPVTLFVDDVQWADSSSSRFLTRLASQGLPRGVLLVVSYRTEELHLNEQLDGLTTLLHDQASRQKFLLMEEQLKSLQPQHLETMLRAVLQLPSEPTTSPHSLQELVTLVHDKTLGNPFYVRRFLQTLLETQALQPSGDQSRWRWSMQKIRQSLPTDNVVGMLVSELDGQPAPQKLILMVASLLGSTFDLRTLASLLDASEVSIWNELLHASAKGYVCVVDGVYPSTEHDDAIDIAFTSMADFIHVKTPSHSRHLSSFDDAPPSLFSRSETEHSQRAHEQHDMFLSMRYQWEHDRIQQAAYQLINQEDRAQAHLVVGCWLVRSLSPDDLEDDIFDVVHHFLRSIALLSDAQDKLNLAKLLLLATRKAKSRAAFDASLMYSKEAINLLPDDVWTAHYELAFLAYYMLVEAHYHNTDYLTMKALVDQALREKLTDEHRTLMYEMEILFYNAQARVHDSVKCGIKALDAIGYELSLEPSNLSRLRKLTDVPLANIPDLAHLPLLTEGVELAASRILVAILPSVYFTNPALLTPLILTLVNISLTHGNSAHAAYGYSVYGMLLAQAKSDVVKAYQYGQLALKILELVPPSPFKCATTKVFASHVQLWAEPLKNVFETFELAISIGKTYFSEYLGYAIDEMLLYAIYPPYKLMGGVPLHQVVSEYDYHRSTIESLKAPSLYNYFIMGDKMARHLTQTRCTPVSEFLNTDEPTSVLNADAMSIKFVYWILRTTLHLLADEMDDAYACSVLAEEIQHTHLASLFSSEHHFVRGLVLVSCCTLKEYESKKAEHLSALDDIIVKYEYWAQHCPSTFECRLRVLQGCRFWLQGDVVPALERLEDAAESARQHALHNVEALAHEMTAKLWLWSGRRSLAAVSFRAAHVCYRRWGAHWKADMMQRLDELHSSGHALPGGEASPTTAAIRAADKKSDPDAVDEIDVETLSNWTSALVSAKSPEALLEQFMRLSTMYGGARRGCLMWAKDPSKGATGLQDMKLVVTSALDQDNTVKITMDPAETHVDLAPIANYAIRTHNTVSDGSSITETLVQSGHISAHCGSFVFYPIVHHDVCVGALYLANELAQQAFGGTKRMSLLRLLLSQLQTSYENLRLVKELRKNNETLKTQAAGLEAMVEDRTQDLALTNRQLVQQVAERERAEATALQAALANRSFLHTMSHELRTPLNCIIGMTELLAQMTLVPEQMDLLRPIQSSAKDLLQIINDILDLSKIESGKLVINRHNCCLREIIDNAVETIGSQAINKSIAIASLYPANVPSAIHHDANRIGQILRNLLSNAVKFTAEGEVMVEVAAEPSPKVEGQLRFTIRCIDTGIGIPEEDMDKLFKPFSQVDNSLSRRFGGTGLGLNISKKFAELLHAASDPTLPDGLTVVLSHSSALMQRMLVGYLQSDKHRIVELKQDELATYRPTPAAAATSVIITDPAMAAASQLELLQLPIIYIGNKDAPSELPRPSAVVTLRTPLRRSTLISALSTVFGQSAPRPTPRAQNKRPQFSLRVLMAEDNPVNQSMAERMLRKFGIAVTAVVNGSLAVDACADRTWDLVFMDVMMPVMDGHQATRLIRAQTGDKPQPKIIALTANAFAEDKALCLEAGMDDVLTKPLTFQALEAMLLRYFEPQET